MSNQPTTEEWVKRQTTKEQAEKIEQENSSDSQTQASEQPIENLDITNLIQRILPIIAAIGGIGFIFSAAGFIVVNVSLGWFTDIQLYSVNPTQYIPAGVILFLVFLILIAPPFIIQQHPKSNQVNTRRWALALSGLIPLIILPFLIALTFALSDHIDRQSFIRNTVLVYLGTALIFYLQFRLYREKIGGEHFFQLIIVFISILFYFTLIFAAIPRNIGGGRPATVQIVFDDSTSLSQIGLPISDDADNVSKTVCLLAELNDGLLIYVPSDVQGQQYTLTVPQEMIVSLRDTQEIIDCSAPNFANQSLPSPTPLATIQATPTAQPTATP